MAEKSELHRAPEYQRKFRWDEEAESRLIESLLLGLPVPNLFFATNPDGTWKVVDGLHGPFLRASISRPASGSNPPQLLRLRIGRGSLRS